MEASAGRSRGLELALIVLFVFLIRLPFLNQAIQGDDVYYLAGAEHAQIEPLHPNHVEYVFLGDPVDLRGHPHPPFNAWFLGLLLALTGDIKEIPFHAAYILFSLIAALAMWSLARRFSPRPVWATLLFLAAPVFVVNGNSLESDLLFLAFWLAAIALFIAEKWLPAAMAMALAALSAYQAVFLTPILAVYVWLYRRHDRRAWALTLTAPAALLTWQLFERFSTGALPAGVLTGYFQSYGLQELARKLRSALALSGHLWFLIFPLLLPAAAVLSWKKRHARDTQFLAAWTVLFFGGALAIFFAGSARYLLPIVAPLALLASPLRPKWLAAGVAAQLSLGLALAWVNYQHWDGYRRFAASLRGQAAQHRVWIDGEWGLRYYLEAEGGLPLQKGQILRPGDLVVTSELANAVQFTQPVAPLARADVRSSLPLRLIGLDSRSGYSTAAKGLLPFGYSHGPIDRVRVDVVLERRPVRVYLPMNAPEAAEQIVSGIYRLESNAWRWMSGTGTVLLKSPPAAAPLHVAFAIPNASPARTLRLLLDGKVVAERRYPGPGSYMLESPPQLPAGPGATLEIQADRTFSVPGDRRILSVILSGAGFQPLR